jgi:hypothetical protein
VEDAPGVRYDENMRQPAPEIRSEFYGEASRFPETEEDLHAQKAIFQKWRNDPRFEPYWSVLDALLDRSFDQVRKWAAIQAFLPLDDYDYSAARAQEACDLEDAQRRWR